MKVLNFLLSRSAKVKKVNVLNFLLPRSKSENKIFKPSSGQECNDSARTMERMEELLILSQQLDFRWRDQEDQKDDQHYYHHQHTINSITIHLYCEGFFRR